VKLDRSRPAYVIENHCDGRSSEVQPLLVQSLQERGFKISQGTESKRPADVTTVVRYDCQWHWDITWYLLDLQVGLYEAPENLLIASGHSTRSSLARAPANVVVEEAIGAMLGETGKP